MKIQNNFILFISFILLISCKNEEIPIEKLNVRIGIGDINIIDMCSGNYSAVLYAVANQDELTYQWRKDGQVFSNEKSPLTMFEGRETHFISLLVTNSQNMTAAENSLESIELHIYPRTEKVEADDEYGFPINSSLITNTPYTNELIRFKTELESDDLWWEVSDANGNSDTLEGINVDGYNILETSFQDPGMVGVKSFFCENKYEISEKEMSMTLVDILPFENATVELFRLISIAENTEVEAYMEIYIDGTLKLRTVKKTFDGPTNQGNELEWHPSQDLEIGDPGGLIDQLVSTDTEIEIHLMVDGNIVLTEIRKADYLGHFSLPQNKQNINIGGNANAYKAVVVVDSVF